MEKFFFNKEKAKCCCILHEMNNKFKEMTKIFLAKISKIYVFYNFKLCKLRNRIGIHFNEIVNLHQF